ncbi:integration host factor subunit alpha [Pelobacter propionicus]|uniref:Integration host factor subunit alpha n=1 Tax=Pelobacter propionicus (strain DSM 2379 / NBRC 103807 / OttBd1) TaxID=338966 RepID=A1AQ63_PELPD|nr:integration host factor subunit alpha [Pelobacter propionicus]ABK99483.1 bacterial nucleoid protein Hbs [Pelobacter propionicus DSM 2379]
MTKADIFEKVSSNLGYTKKESAELVEAVFSLIKSTLESGEKIKIAGFGNFEVKQKADRRGRNPQNGETITIEARRILTFKPSGVLKTAINGAKQ